MRAWLSVNCHLNAISWSTRPKLHGDNVIDQPPRSTLNNSERDLLIMRLEVAPLLRALAGASVLGERDSLALTAGSL